MRAPVVRMDDDSQALDRITRRETRDRVAHIVSALREHPASPPWAEVYRHAHTLAGIAEPVALEVAEAARDLAARLRDERGRMVELSEDELRAVRADVARLAAWLEELRAAGAAGAAGAARAQQPAVDEFAGEAGGAGPGGRPF